MRDQGLKVKYFYDEESAKGNPTNESFVLTVVYKEGDDFYEIGYSFKVPGDEFIPRIGKAIACRNFMNEPMKINRFEFNTLDFLSYYLLYCEDKNRKMSKELINRIVLLYLIQREKERN